MNFIPFSSKVENLIKQYAIVLTLFLIYIGFFSGITITNPPARLQKIVRADWFKLFTMFLLGLSATGDIEITLISMIIFLGAVHLLRTPEERAQTSGPLDL